MWFTIESANDATGSAAFIESIVEQKNDAELLVFFFNLLELSILLVTELEEGKDIVSVRKEDNLLVVALFIEDVYACSFSFFKQEIPFPHLVFDLMGGFIEKRSISF